MKYEDYHSVMWTAVAVIINSQVTNASKYQAAVFFPSSNCLVSGSIVSTENRVMLKRCAHKCIGEKNCAAIGYTSGTQVCRLGSQVMNSATDDSDCNASEIVYESPTAKQALGCDLADGWVYNTVRSTCIKVFHDLSTRAAAQAKCETWGANLAVWDSQAALNFWQNLVQTDSDWNGDGRGVWSDGMKISGTWTWSLSLSATWFNWNVNEPSGNGICTQLYRNVFRIDDLQCDYQGLQFVCEKSLDT